MSWHYSAQFGRGDCCHMLSFFPSVVAVLLGRGFGTEMWSPQVALLVCRIPWEQFGLSTACNSPALSHAAPWPEM